MGKKNPSEIAFNAVVDLFSKLKKEKLIGVEIEQGKIVPDLSEQDIDREMVFKQMKKIEKLQAELDWHKKELARVDHALVDACDKANKLQADLEDYKQGADTEGREADRLRADLKSVNFSYWKKCEEVNRLQQAVSEAREIFKDELVYCFPESNHWHGEIKKWLEKYGDNNDR
jgi:hypothetical protein